MITGEMVLLGGVALAAAHWGAPLVSRLLSVQRLDRRCKRFRAIVLTFDDGPSRELTPAILDLLSRYEAKATFFVLGSHVPGNECILDRIAQDGHEIGCHGQWHHNAWKSLPWTGLRDIEAGLGSLSRWIKKDAMFRPPHGKLTLVTWLALAARGMPIAWWTVDSGDTHLALPDPRTVSNRIASDSGGVVLLHDFDRSPERMEYVLAVTEIILQTAVRQGLKIIRLGDLSTEGMRSTPHAPSGSIRRS